LSTVKYLILEHGVVWVTHVVDIKVSAVYTALVLNKPDIVKYLIQEQNKISKDEHPGNVHLFNCLVDIRHTGVTTDSRDDVVVTDKSVWCMDRYGDWWEKIMWGDCDVLRHMLCVGLDVNQSIQLCESKGWLCVMSDVRPLLYALIDEVFVTDRTEKVKMLLERGTDTNVRARYSEDDSDSDGEDDSDSDGEDDSDSDGEDYSDSDGEDDSDSDGEDDSVRVLRYREDECVLDMEGVSALERMRRLVCKYNNSKDLLDREYRAPDYMRAMSEVKKHVRRYSV
jgi:hypothetical protein